LFVPANAAHSTTAKDWQWYWAGGSPGVLLVPMDSKYKTFKDLVDDAKARPGQVNVAASVLPGVWSIRWMSIGNAAGIKTNVLPYAGSAPSVTAALTGEVDAVHVSVGEAAVHAGQEAVPVVASGRGSGHPWDRQGGRDHRHLPELKKVLPMPSFWASPSRWTRRRRSEEITKAFDAAMKSEAVKKILDAQVAQPFGWSGDKANNMSKSLSPNSAG
jgi:tripartite-type tricarboxylate transporter receptor subunit TctC